jgi:hypothetical protein
MKQKIQIILILIMVVKVCKKKERIYLSFPPKGGGLLRLSRAFSATLTGRFGIGTEGRW